MAFRDQEGTRTVEQTISNTVHSSQFQVSTIRMHSWNLNKHVLSPAWKALNNTQSLSEFGRLFQSIGLETAKLHRLEQLEEHPGMS